MNELSEFIMDELSKFIKAHVNEINNNNFAKVYEDTNDSLTPCLLTSKLTEAHYRTNWENCKKKA